MFDEPLFWQEIGVGQQDRGWVGWKKYSVLYVLLHTSIDFLALYCSIQIETSYLAS